MAFISLSTLFVVIAILMLVLHSKKINRSQNRQILYLDALVVCLSARTPEEIEQANERILKTAKDMEKYVKNDEDAHDAANKVLYLRNILDSKRA